MNTYLKYKPAWLQLVIFMGITIGIAVVATFGGLTIVAHLNHMNFTELSELTPEDLAKPAFASVSKGELVVQFFGIFLLPSLAFAYLSDPKPLHFAGFKRPGKMIFILLGIIVILSSYLMVQWLMRVNQSFVQHFFGEAAKQWIAKGESDVDGTLKNILTMKDYKDLLFSILLVGVMAAVGEELFFRGILQRIIIQIFRNPWIGIIVTAAIFSAIHGQFLGFIPRMILGMVLGALYWYSGSLWPSILGHFIFNSFQIIMLLLSSYGP